MGSERLVNRPRPPHHKRGTRDRQRQTQTQTQTQTDRQRGDTLTHIRPSDRQTDTARKYTDIDKTVRETQPEDTLT